MCWLCINVRWNHHWTASWNVETRVKDSSESVTALIQLYMLLIMREDWCKPASRHMTHEHIHTWSRTWPQHLSFQTELEKRPHTHTLPEWLKHLRTSKRTWTHASECTCIYTHARADEHTRRQPFSLTWCIPQPNQKKKTRRDERIYHCIRVYQHMLDAKWTLFYCPGGCVHASVLWNDSVRLGVSFPLALLE